MVNYNVYQPDAQKIYQAGQNAFEDGLQQRQRNILGQAGNMLGQGNKQGARDTLFQGGMINEGAAIDKQIQAGLRQAKQDQLAKAKRMTDIFGNLAMSTGDDDWPEVLEAMKARGMDVSRFAGPQGRQMALAESGQTKTMLDMELKRRLAEMRAQASQAKIQAKSQPAPYKLTATDRREIFEADETMLASSNVARALDRALELNSRAYSGPLSETRGYLTSIYGAEGGEATEELNNLIKTQVLENLKATFGGMPTEGERKVMMEVQGSTDKSPEVRERIYQRAKEAAERRMRFNQLKAQGIRTGEYYQPGYGQQAAPQSAPQPAPSQPASQSAPPQARGGSSPLDMARDAIARGAPREAVIQRLRENGIDPSGL